MGRKGKFFVLERVFWISESTPVLPEAIPGSACARSSLLRVPLPQVSPIPRLSSVAPGSTEAQVSSRATSARGDLAPTSPIPAWGPSPGDVRALAGAWAGNASSPAAIQTISQRHQIMGETPALALSRDTQGSGAPQGHELPGLPGWIATPSP